MCRIFQTVVVCYVFLHLASSYEFVEGGIREEGESCDDNGKAGTCTRITKCHVFTERGQWWRLKICGFDGFESVVCCPARASTTSTTTTTTTSTPKPVATTPPTGDTTTEYTPPLYDYGETEYEKDGCPPILPGMTTEPIGKKSWDKCIEYQMQLIYPCEESISVLGSKVRRDNCRHNDGTIILGGIDVYRDEFPHMVLLGYGQVNGSAVWQCGGALISDRFILTAAHCTRTKDLGYVNYAIVGSLKRTDNVEPWQVYRIKQIIKHPDFNPRTGKNDIALLETDPIRLGASVVPACLDVFGGDHHKAVATGWGAPAIWRDDANTLQKVTLTEFTDRECSDHYPVKQGSTFNSTTQVCYGNSYRNADTCQGDSGGPLTILNHRLHCMYTVVGITSIGVNCGTPGQPGWYTKVSHYVPWIERIVWP